MVFPEPPYPPSPRHAPADLGRRAPGTPARKGLVLTGYLFGVGLFASAPFVAAGLAALFLQADELPPALRIVGFIVCLGLAIVYIKSWLPRQLRTFPAVKPVIADELPTLYAFVARVAEDVGWVAPHWVCVGSGVELRLAARWSLLDLIRRPALELNIGLWLAYAVTLSEFQALIARTIAPFARSRTERLRFNARALLDAQVRGQDRIDELSKNFESPVGAVARIASAIHAIAVTPFRLLGRAILKLEDGAEWELANDLAAVRVCGSDALVHAILRADFAAAALQKIDEVLFKIAADGVITRDLYDHIADGAIVLREAHNDFTLGEPPMLRGPSAGKYADVFEPGKPYLSNNWQGLPGPAEREQNAKAEFVAAERDDRPASALLDNPSPLREELTRQRYSQVYRESGEYLPMPADTIRRWLAAKPDDTFPAHYAGCYDGGRKIEPGSSADRDAALSAEEWTDARLLTTAAGLYSNAAERAATWSKARRTLDRLLRRTVYRPLGRQQAQAEDLEDDLRKAGRWLAALDRWVYVVHVHMAARLPDLALHNELLLRYESVLRFQPLAADAREYYNRVAAYAFELEVFADPSYRLRRDAGREFASSINDLAAFLRDADAIDDPYLKAWTGDMVLRDLLFAHTELPTRGEFVIAVFGRKLLKAWNEVAAKSRWLDRLGVRALLDVQERVLEEFTVQVGPLPAEPEPIVLEPLAEELPEAAVDPVPLEAELVEDGDLPFADDEAEAEDYWGPRGSNRM
jgi:hypothetical protein